MRILEVRDGFIKIESEENIKLSSFVLVNDTLKSYVAQVIQVKNAGSNTVAYAKLLYLYNGSFIDYDKSMPSSDSEALKFEFENFNKILNIQNSVVIGKFLDDQESILADLDMLNQKTLICIDSNEDNRIIVNNLAKQFSSSLVIDTLGIFEKNKYIAGVDFKLPLNTEALDFLFEDCLNDATSDSKNLIKEIFHDLAEYSKTVPFLPFATLKTIIDDMVEKSHIFKLLVLKNKLAKFDKLGYFAANSHEAENLNKILANKNVVIDLSKLDTVFQNRYLNIILATLEKQNAKTQVFVEASNALSKKTLKKILTRNNGIFFVTHSRFKFINEIRTMFKNFIIEPNFINANNIFKTYATFLNAMQKKSYLAVGAFTNYIPLVSLIVENTSIQEQAEIIDLDEELKISLSEQMETDSEENPSVIAIDEKSKELVEKVSEEIQFEQSQEISIFDDEVEHTEIAEDYNASETQQEELVELDEQMLEVSESEIVSENIELTSEDNEFHTRVDSFQISEIDDADNDNVMATEELPIENEEVDIIEGQETPVTIEEEQITIQIDDSLADEIVEETVPEIVLEEYKEEIIEASQEETVESELETVEVIPVEEEPSEEFGEIIELDNTEIGEDDIIVEFEDAEISSEEELDKAIVADVDRVFTTIKEDDISDSDLDFIDELNGTVEAEEELVLDDGMEELTELPQEEDEDENLLEPLEEIKEYAPVEEEREILETRNTATPIVPVYEAEIPPEDIVSSDPIEQGDTIVHAKYGNGVVEKMIKYGTKTLYSINFDNVGRRLLDPTLTEIKKA